MRWVMRDEKLEITNLMFLDSWCLFVCCFLNVKDSGTDLRDM
jgi:hypothetical protein